MNRLLSFLAVVGIAFWLFAPPVVGEEYSASDYIEFHKPLLGSWNVTVEEGDKTFTGKCEWRLAPNTNSFLLNLEVEGLPAAQFLHGYDPVGRKLAWVSFDAEGTYQVGALEIAGMKKGKKLAVGPIGKWEAKRFSTDGTVTAATETLSCTEMGKNRMVFVWSNRKEKGKSLPDWKLTYQRRGTDKQAESSSNYEHLKPLEWLNGEWVGEYVAPFDLGTVKRGDRVTSYASGRWMLRKNFMVVDFRQEIDGKRIPDTHEIIGWDLAGKKLVHWIYSPLGAGTGVWTKVGPKAVLRWSVDGKDGELEGTSTLKKVDENTHTWQATDVTLDDQKMPDFPEVTMRRAKGVAASDLWKAYRNANAGTWLGTGTLGRDSKDLGLSKGDKFTYRLTWRPDLDGRVLIGEGDFRIAAKDYTSKVRAICCWDPAMRQIRLVACWSSGLVEEALIGGRTETGYVATYIARSPENETMRARVRLEYTDADSYVITFVDGPNKGEKLASWKREK